MTCQVIRPAATILVADDDEGVRALFSRVLRSAGHRVLVADDGGQNEALARPVTRDALLAAGSRLLA